MDSSVFVSAARPAETGFGESAALLKWVRSARPRLFLPTLLLTETVAARHRLRGADEVYVATASLFAAELVTLDKEQLARGAGVVRTFRPAGFVATV